METLPNEIFLQILSHLPWFDALTSFWSLNCRFNSLVCLTLSRDNNQLNNGPFTTDCLPYQKCHSILYSLISHSPSLCSSIQNIHFDGSNSNSYDLCFRWLFNDEKILRFPNLKSLAFIRCESIKPVIFSLLHLVKHQLNKLTLTFDEHAFGRFHFLALHHLTTSGVTNRNPVDSEKEEQMNMIKKLLRLIFSDKCHLQYLRLDISKDCQCGPLHKCLSTDPLNEIPTHPRSKCIILRHVDIRVNSACFLLNLIEHVPNLEQFSVELISSLNIDLSSEPNEKNWFNKLPKLRSFALKTTIYKDIEFASLQWILNKMNHVEKLAVYLKGHRPTVTDREVIWQCSIDASFVRQYCLPDTIPNLINFNFYIGSASQSSSDDIEERINSFKIHPFFQNHQWTNVKCLFDPIQSCQHFFSDFPNNSFDYSILFSWTYYDRFSTPAPPSLCLLLKQFKQLSPNISSITVNKMHDEKFNQSDLRKSSKILLKFKQRVDMPFRHVTRIQLGSSLTIRSVPYSRSPIRRNPLRDKVFARLLSLTVQLKYLKMEQFEWLLHIVQHASDELRTNALSSVQYVEFLLPSCHMGDNEHIHIGKHLVPLLATYMPRLQTLRLWRPDDFPWTSIRPTFSASAYATYRWMRSLRTDQSIDQHVAVFEQDLCQLFEQLKELTFLDISGKIDFIKIDRYHSMARTRFPDSLIDVEISRFRL